MTHVCFFLFPQRVPSDLEEGYEKSILTRTETFPIRTICFKETQLFITLFLKRMYFYEEQDTSCIATEGKASP